MGKVGSSGGGSPKLDYTDLWNTKAGLQNLTMYQNGLTPTAADAGNWALDLASGGNITQGTSATPLWYTNGTTMYPAFGGSSGSTGTAGGNGGTTTANDSSLLGPFLSNAWNYAMPNEEGMQSELSSLFGQEGQDASSFMTGPNGSIGLTSGQQAYVDQATSSGQAAIQQQLASEGLTGSTSNVMLQNEQQQAGAATAGQLIQGNEQLVQQAQQLGLNTEEAQFAQQASIFSQSSALQNQLFNQGMESYQLSNQMINTSLSGYNSTLAAIQADNQDRLQTAQLEASISAQENQASSSGFSSLLGGLGTLFGSSSSTGGLIGSIGGLFGSSGALSGAGGAISGALAAFAA